MPSRSRPSPASSAGSDAIGLTNRNRLLSALPPKEFGRLRRRRMTVTLKQRDSVWQPNQPIEAIYFPLDAVVSVLAVADGGVIEVATIGNEGIVGLPVFLGAQSSPGMAFCQVAGRAERLAADVFLREAHRDGALRRLLQLYSQGFMVQVSQATVEIEEGSSRLPVNVTGSCVTSSTAYSQFGRSEGMATIADVLAFVARVEAFLTLLRH